MNLLPAQDRAIRGGEEGVDGMERLRFLTGPLV
jgi:hypothetical protein